MPDRETGTSDPGLHCGQVGHPRPDPVTRTVAPVTPMAPLVITASQASTRWTRWVGQRRHHGNRIGVTFAARVFTVIAI